MLYTDMECFNKISTFSNLFLNKRRPRTCWRDYICRLAWKRLGIPPAELGEVAGEREIWAALLRVLP